MEPIVSAGLALEVAVDCIKFQRGHALRLALIDWGGGLSRAFQESLQPLVIEQCGSFSHENLQSFNANSLKT